MASALSYPVRHPRWVLTYAGANISADVSGMVTEISYTDKVAHSFARRERVLAQRAQRAIMGVPSLHFPLKRRACGRG